MNRLVIIGNGFDLAHGLPTSYRDFIDDYWKNFKDKCKTDEYKELVYTHDLYNGYYNGYKSIENFSDFISNLTRYCEDNKHDFNQALFRATTKPIAGFQVIFYFNNDFFKLINQKSVENWVDIENEYYRELKGIVKSLSMSIEDKERKTIVLNKEFEQVKKLFEKYLIEKVLSAFNFYEYKDYGGNMFKFPHLFKPVSYKDNSDEMKLFLGEFPLRNQEDLRNQFIYRGDDLISDCMVTFLNFNYTPTLWNYSRILLKDWGVNNEIIYIHGSLNDKENMVNFGFGDEMDEDYKSIENLDDNEYLRNFKSFQYLHTPNYKHLLDLIDRDHFQVYIMGHSCGLSDRIMLNTIFEHSNCISIKVFYHQRKDGTDNYTEIIQNISRHFNDKKIMRSKIVNKTLCQPLPQIQLPKKE